MFAITFFISKNVYFVVPKIWYPKMFFVAKISC